MENFIIVIGWLMRAGGSSYALNSCAIGKAPIIPYKWYNKAFSGKKRKCLKIIVNAIKVKVEPFTYHKPKSKPKQKPLLLHQSNKPI